MNVWIGSILSLGALVSGGFAYGWRGVILALSVIVFWLLLQFSRLMRVMHAVQRAPVGRISNAVMFSSQLQSGMKLLDVLPLAGSLGRKLHGAPGTYEWTDAGGVRVELVLERGLVASWQLIRPSDSAQTQDVEMPGTSPAP